MSRFLLALLILAFAVVPLAGGHASLHDPAHDVAVGHAHQGADCDHAEAHESGTMGCCSMSVGHCFGFYLMSDGHGLSVCLGSVSRNSNSDGLLLRAPPLEAETPPPRI